MRAAAEIRDLVVDLLDATDRARAFPAQFVLQTLCEGLDASGAVLQWVHWPTGQTRIEHFSVDGTSDVEAMVSATRDPDLRNEHPLFAAAAAGRYGPTTAEREAGGARLWRRTATRSFLATHQHCDQMASTVLDGTATTFYGLAVARPGRDFDDDALGELALLTPVLRALHRHVVALGSPVASSASAAAPAPALLTNRETAVLLCVERGSTAAAVAHRLGCSPRTVEKHLSHVYRKLEVTDRLSAVLQARRLGLLPPQP